MNELVRNLDDVERAATAMAASGFFADARAAAQAMVKIMAGSEMGFGPFASMTGISIINGRPSIGANLMAAAVKRSGKYDYRVVEMTDTVVEIAFFEAGRECGRSRFTLEDARRAGTKNLDRFPRNMLFARAMSNGVRWYCPDVFSGSAVYVPEELGAVVDGDGNIITEPQHQHPILASPAAPATPPAEPPAPEPAAEPAPAETLIEPPTPEPAAPEPAAAPATLSDARAEWSRVWNIAKRAGLKPPVLNGKWSIEEIVEHTEILRAEIAEAEAAASTPAAKES